MPARTSRSAAVGSPCKGGAGTGWRNYASIENHGGDQILRFAAGAPLSLTGGTVGSKHFAAIEAMGSTASQQILGNPVITLTGGASGGGDGTGSFATFLGNNAAIVTDPGTVDQPDDQRAEHHHAGRWWTRQQRSHRRLGHGAPQTITVVGDLRMHGGTAAGTQADLVAFGHQTISARSIEMVANWRWYSASIYYPERWQQTIATTGSGPNGWGIELTNHGTADGQPVYINSSGAQQIEALDGGGILLDAVAGVAEMRANGAQSITIDGATSPNALVVRATAGRAEIHGQSQSIVAGSAGSGSITLQGGSANYAAAFVFTDAGTQNISTTGQLSIIAGSAPDIGQQPLHCDQGGACSLIGNVFEGSVAATPIQTITALGGISIVGGSSGAHNDTGIFSRGSEVINAPGGITLQAGGGGPNNFATIAMDRAGYFQSVDFGAGGLTILANAAGANGNYAEIYSSGTQTITGTGDIRLEGGVAGGRSWAHITGTRGPGHYRTVAVRDGACRSRKHLSVQRDWDPKDPHNRGRRRRSERFRDYPAQPGRQRDQSFRLPGRGLDHHSLRCADPGRGGLWPGCVSLGMAAMLSSAAGSGSRPSPTFKGVSQAITVHGTGANAIVVDAGAGRAQLYSYSTASQTITAGLAGEQGSISVLGGAATGATGNITADTGTQTLVTSGTLTVTGGTAPQIASLNFDQADCLPGLRKRVCRGGHADARCRCHRDSGRGIGQREPGLGLRQRRASGHGARRGRAFHPGRWRSQGPAPTTRTLPFSRTTAARS